MGNRQLDFGVDHQIGDHKHIEGVSDHPFRRVLHRHDAEISPAATDILKDGGNALLRDELRRIAELAHGGDMGVGSLRPQKDHLHRVFESERGGDNLAPDAANSFLRERSAIGGRETLEDGPFARRNIKILSSARLGLPDFESPLCPLIEQVKDGIIDSVDLFAQFVQTLCGHPYLQQVKNGA